VKVTLYTDASLSTGKQRKLSGWGMVAVVEGMPPWEASGAFRQPAATSTHAELYAIANAVYWLIRQGVLVTGHHLHIRCDNEPVVKWMAGEAKVKQRNADMAQVITMVRRVLTDTGVGYSAEWIRGHQQDNGSPEVTHQRRADKLACIASGVQERRNQNKVKRRTKKRARVAQATARLDEARAKIEAAQRGGKEQARLL
jgi:ribonuclease HI